MSVAGQEVAPGIKHFWDRSILAVKLYRNYRLLWLGSLTEHMGEMMETAATLWLLYQLGATPFLLAMVPFLRSFPLIFLSPLGGQTADRVNRRNLLIYTLLFMAFLSVILLFLVRTGQVQVWHILVLAFGRGLATAFNHPARQTLVPNLVERKHLMNAISLDALTVRASVAIGMPAAGLLIAQVGVEPVFGVNAIGCLVAIVWLLMIKLRVTPGVLRRESFWRNLIDGWSYLKSNALLRSLVALYFLEDLFRAGLMSFMPIFANDILGVGARGYGLLQAAGGYGAIIALLALATIGNLRRKGLYLFVAAIGLAASLALFSISQVFLLSLFLLLLHGMLSSTYSALNTTMVQSVVEDSFRGRVMAWREIAFGLAPVVGLFVGKTSEYLGPTPAIGVPNAILLVALVALAVVLALAFRLSRVRKLE